MSVPGNTAVAVAALIAVSLPAMAAADVGVVAVRTAHSPVPKPELEAAVARALRGLGETPVADPAQVARDRLGAGAVRRQRLAGFREARELLAEGWRAYALVQTERARDRLAEARRRALSVADLIGGVELLAEISLRLGVLELELGRAAEAEAEFRLAQRLAPERAVTINQFKPAVVNAFRAAVAAPSIPRPVKLTRRPADVAVEIDGRRIDPASALELEVGLHLVIGRHAGREPSRELIRVESAGVSIAVAPAPDPHSAPLFGEGLVAGRRPEPATALAAAATLFADLGGVMLVAAVWRGGEPALIGQWCGGEPLRCGKPVEVRFASSRGLPAASTEVIERARRERRRLPVTLLGDDRVARAEAEVVATPAIESRPWWKSPWLWAGVGAAAVAAGTAAILTRDRPIEVVIESDPCQFGGC